MFGAVPFGGMAFASLLTPVVSGGGGGDTPNAALLSPQLGLGIGIGYGI